MSSQVRLFTKIDGETCVMERRVFSQGMTVPTSSKDIISLDFDKIKALYTTKIANSLSVKPENYASLNMIMDKAFTQGDVMSLINDKAYQGLNEEEITSELLRHKPNTLLNLDFGTLSNLGENAELKTFSVSSIKERLRINKLNPRQRFRRMVMDYMMFASKMDNLSQDEQVEVRNMFIQDVMGVFSSISKELSEGGNLMTILGLTTFGKDVRDAAKVLSPLYRKSIQLTEATGDVPKAMFMRLDDANKAFMDALKKYVFEESLTNPNLLQTQDALEIE